MTPEQLLVNITSVPRDQRKTMQLPDDWLTDHQTMIDLVDEGILGMDGFRYVFAEMAKENWRRCHK